MRDSLIKLWEQVLSWSQMIKLEHTLFSLPFLLSSLFIAVGPNKFLPEFKILFFSAIALFGARSAAMSLNRIIDRKIDALNPRTKDREIPKKKISLKLALVFSILGFIIMFLATLNLPKLCLYLSPLAVIWLTFYSYTKRFTYLTHYVLGLALGASVFGGWIAITGKTNFFALILSLAVSLWVAGFDIIYSIQDLKFDRKIKLYSIPARFGLKKSLQISQITHLVSGVVFLLPAIFGFKEIKELLVFYCFACFILALGLIKQHLGILKNISSLKKVINLYFFEFNAWISVLFFLFILLGKSFNLGLKALL